MESKKLVKVSFALKPIIAPPIPRDVISAVTLIPICVKTSIISTNDIKTLVIFRNREKDWRF
jgi:hypothetical protein